MRGYLLRRFLYMFFTWWLLSVVVFIIIQLPPGDMLTTYIDNLEASGEFLDQQEVANLKEFYALDRSMVEQYVAWITRFVRGEMGISHWTMYASERPVAKILGEVVPFTVLLSAVTLVVTYLLAIPIGIYSATHQYKIGDYVFTGFGFIGLAIPDFMLALLLMFFFFRFFGISAGGLFSPEMALEPWGLEKVWDLIQHLWIPVIVIATAGTAALVRTLRATLLDELGKQYVITARAKGVPERRLLFKYPVRLAINPLVSAAGYLLPNIFGGSTITAIVLSLPMTGPVLLEALMGQDMHLAGAILMVEGALVIFGTLLSDMLLAVVDPRIRQERSV